MERNRIYSLDLLKFIVSIVIVVLHIQQESRIGLSVINLASGKIYTWYIVELLFIISGFLSMLYFSSDEKIELSLQNGFSLYLKHKCIRIYPMVILSTIFYLLNIVLYKLFFKYWLHNIVPGLWRVLNSILLTNEGSISYFNSPTWYLSVLLLCYCFEYFIVFLCKRMTLKIEYFFVAMVLLGITGYCYGLNLPLLSYHTCRGYASFFIGCLIYKLYNNQKIKIKRILIGSIIAFTFCVIAGIVDFNLFYDDETCQWGVFTVILNPSIFIIFLESNRWFKSSKWQILGNISFEIYLFHMPFIILYLIFCDLCPKMCISEMLQISIFIVLMIIISFIIFTFIEKPITRKLSNRFEKNQDLQKE